MELLKNLVLVWLLRGFFVESHDVCYHLGVLSACILGNATLVDETLPFFRKALQPCERQS
jgi:hypothetical protein